MTTTQTYYHILQVAPDADLQAIRAAYRRLMRLYHPDLLPPEQQADPAIQELSRRINEAYAILSDPAARAVYDGMLRAGRSGRLRLAHIRCSRTQSTFSAVLLLDPARDDLFRVVEFGAVEPRPRPTLAERVNSVLWGRRTWARPRAINPLGRLLGRSESLAVEQDLIDFGKIDWGGLLCPDCGQTSPGPEGVRLAWAVCPFCKLMLCGGGVVKSLSHWVVKCPWCDIFRGLGKSFNRDPNATFPVRGTRPHGPDPRALKDQPLLPPPARTED